MYVGSADHCTIPHGARHFASASIEKAPKGEKCRNVSLHGHDFNVRGRISLWIL